jgi:predicted RNase H-like HicB family nuclease
MKYPVYILKEKKSDYGVTVPDLPGCFSGGATFEEALKNVQEAIACHCEGLLMDGETIPQPGLIENHQKKHKNKKAVWALVDFNISSSGNRAR